MKTLKTAFYLLMVLITHSCEEVIEIDLKTPESRLVINAALEWPKGTSGNYQTIEITTPANYYDASAPRVSGAIVKVSDSEGNEYNFIEGQQGLYECFDFEPVIDRIYELEIIYDGEVYTASEQLKPVVSFDYAESFPLPGGSEGYEVRAYFTDPEEADNFYLIQETNNRLAIPGYHTFNDLFFNGNQNYASHFGDVLEVVDTVEFKLYGVSSAHHQYLFRLLSSVQNGPFQPLPGVNRGNIINTTISDHYALGYFSVSETSSISKTISNE